MQAMLVKSEKACSAWSHALKGGKHQYVMHCSIFIEQFVEHGYLNSDR